MAAQQIIINIDDVNVTVANWNGYLEIYPLNAENPEDVSDVAKKIAYIVTKLTAKLNHDVKRGRQILDSRVAHVAVPDIDLNA